MPYTAPVPLLTTKLALPTVRSVRIPHPRLTTRLNSAVGARLAIVVAPAGWGKSTLVQDWGAQGVGGLTRVAWVSLDPGDNDPNRFLLYAAAAFDTVEPGLGDSARFLLLSA